MRDKQGTRVQLVYTSICPPGQEPATAQQLEALGFVRMMDHGNKWDYLAQIEAKSKRYLSSFGLVKIGNLANVRPPASARARGYTVKTYNVIPDYVVTFVADGKTVKTMTVEQGYKLKDSDYPTVPAKTGYTGEWKKYTTAISTDVTVVAVYTKIAARHTVTFKADGKVLKTMTVRNGYILKDSDYPSIPVKKGYTGSWPKTVSVIRADTVISAIYKSTGGGGITVPTRPSGEIMSVDEVEPIEEEAADENAVAPQATHLASTQTVTHEYLTQSGKVMRETVRTDGTVTSVLDFIYDESGKPFAMVDQLSAQPKTYYYVLNLQGDVVKLVDVSGAEVASYEYDAWGNVLSQSGSMASTNPRYRGYYYDSETGFYYLQSRYYDPANRRFINADSYAGTGQGILGWQYVRLLQQQSCTQSGFRWMLVGRRCLGLDLRQRWRSAGLGGRQIGRSSGLDSRYSRSCMGQS